MSKKPLTLDSIRAEIAAVEAELDLVKNAGLPVETVEAGLRAAFAEAQGHFEAVVQNAAIALAAGEDGSFGVLIGAPIQPERFIKIALGAAVKALGTDAIIAEAQERAADMPQAELRLPAAERRERLNALQRKLHDLGLAEENLVVELGLPRRPNASAACVLGLPYSEADDMGLLRAA